MTLDERIRAVRAIVLDVDGVLTDGRLGYLPVVASSPELVVNGPVKFFHARDGHWIKLAIRAGLLAGIISGRDDVATRRRADELGLSFCVTGARKKVPELERLTRELGITPAECLYIGDDIVDLPVMKRVGVAVAVADAVPERDEVADWRTRLPGGHGAVYEVIHQVLAVQGRLEALLETYRA